VGGSNFMGCASSPALTIIGFWVPSNMHRSVEVHGGVTCRQ